MLITESTYKYLDNHKDIVEKLKKIMPISI